MALKFHPHLGQILICNYDIKALGGEMVKSRPCIVVSPRLRKRDGLCTVVPLSTTEPYTLERWHHSICLKRPLPKPFDSLEMWAKCDMLSTVSFKRLNLIKLRKDQYGKRKYLEYMLLDDDIEHVKNGVLAALGHFN